MDPSKLRNIAIVAHVDHGKTTLVDQLLRQSGTFRSNQTVVDRVMDSNVLERERGITILAKNTAIRYNGFKINIVDTPGHADFSGEVERTLSMVDSVLLVVDAFDGPMPQTKFVLRKSLELDLEPIVVINKIDRDGARPMEVMDAVFDLFVELGATDEQLDFGVVFTSARNGVATTDLDHLKPDMRDLFEMIVERVRPPMGDGDAPLQFLVTSLDYDPYLGRLALGRIVNGRLSAGDRVAVMTRDGRNAPGKVSHVFGFEGLDRNPQPEASIGDIVLLAGLDEVKIGETVASAEAPAALPPISIGEPTVSMTFRVNDSPFAGREGKFVTSRHLRERLEKELRTNVALRVVFPGDSDLFEVSGRGELHLAILLETLRREGYELQVSRPQVITREIDGDLHEPMERLWIDVDEAYVGIVMEKMGRRRGRLDKMGRSEAGQSRLEFVVPARGLIGYRGEFLTDTRGTGVMHHQFEGYAPFAGEIGSRINGALVSMEEGEAVPYTLEKIQERGTLFVEPQIAIYKGMIVGEHSRPKDLFVNPCKKKHLTNIRSSTAEDAIVLTPPRKMSLEDAIEWIGDGEWVELTPVSVRLRKASA